MATKAKGYYFIRHNIALSSSSSTYPTPLEATSSICTQPLKNPMQTFWSNDCLKRQLTNKRGNVHAMGAYFISKASPPPFGSSFDLPLSTLPCTTKSEHLRLFFQLWFCVSHFRHYQHFIAKTRAKDVVCKWILPSNKWVCLAQTHPSNKWVDPKVPHAHPLALGSKNLTRSLHIRYCPKVGTFPKKQAPKVWSCYFQNNLVQHKNWCSLPLKRLPWYLANTS